MKSTENSPRSGKNEGADSEPGNGDDVAQEDTDMVDNPSEEEQLSPQDAIPEEIEKQRDSISLTPKLIKSLIHR